MSHTLSESGAAFPTPITVPDPGDDANADDLELILQALVDRDAYLKALAETSGVKMLRTVAGTSALKAIDTSSGMTDGELRYLAGTDFNGLYKYVAGSVLAEALPWVVAPTTGSGRWIHEL